MLCGDEIGGAIADLGSCTCRFGTAGQDTPRYLIPSVLGQHEDSPQYFVGDQSLRSVRSNVEVMPLLHGAEINWDGVEQMLSFGMQGCLREDICQCPLLLTESVFGSSKSKETLLEVIYEKLSAPALYIASNATLSSFSGGKPTSLVVDLGHSSTTITPVVDGYPILHATSCTSRGGHRLDGLIRDFLDQNGSQLIPWYDAVNSSQTSRTATHSFREYHVTELIRDVKKWMSFVPYNPIPLESRVGVMSQLTIPPYELPDRTLIHPSDGLCTISERLWFATSQGSPSASAIAPFPIQETITSQVVPASTSSRKRVRTQQQQRHQQQQPHHPPQLVTSEPVDPSVAAKALYHNSHHRNIVFDDESSLPRLIQSTVGKCDTEVRKELLSNILLSGGGSLIDGVANRLQYELTELLPTSYKVKFLNSLPAEKLHSSWIGGSILSICGSFQQLWTTRQEYAEAGGRALIEDRFVH